MNVSAADLYHLHPFASICIHLHGVTQPGGFKTKVEEPEEPAEAIFHPICFAIHSGDIRRQFLWHFWDVYCLWFYFPFSRRPGKTIPGNPASRTRAGVRIGKMKAGHSDMHLDLKASYHCQCNLTPKKQTGESLWMWTRLDRGFSFMKPNMTNVYENHGYPALWIPHLLMSPGERWWMSHQHRFPKGILSIKINAAGSKQKSGIIPGYWSAVMPECIALWKSCGYVY